MTTEAGTAATAAVVAAVATVSGAPVATDAQAASADPPTVPAAADATLPSTSDSGGAEWLVLTDHRGREPRRPGDPPSLRRVLLQFCAAAAIVVTIVGIAGAVISERTAERQSVHMAAQITDAIATAAVQPVLTSKLISDPTSQAPVLDPIVRSIKSTSLVRVKIWSPEGKILYSDQKDLVGMAFQLDDEAEQSFLQLRTQASISDLHRPENRDEVGFGKLLEVYRPVWTQNGRILLLETYFTYDSVTESSRGLWRGFVGIMLSSLVAVLVLLLPLLWTLGVRSRRAQAQREALMQRALDASSEERKRIAGNLHDGVVQDLVAASFAVAAVAEQATAAGEHQRAARLGAAASAVRSSIGGLRSLLVDIYPANLRSAGLPAALRDLVATMSGRTVTVELDIEPGVTEHLSTTAQEAIFRVAQECLRNVVKHSGASVVSISVTRHARDVRLEIADDGRGFDIGERLADPEHGHIGLQLISDMASTAGARLQVCTREGDGTIVRMDVPPQ